MSRWTSAILVIGIGCSSQAPQTPAQPAVDAGAPLRDAGNSPGEGGNGGAAARSSGGTSAGGKPASGGTGGKSGSAADGGKGGAQSSGGAGAGGGGTSAPEDAGTPPVNCVGQTPLEAYVADPKLCVYVYAEDVAGARGMAFASNGDLFVSNSGKLTVLWDADGNGKVANNERMQFASAAGLNHGVVFSRDEAFVYASSGSTVYRWAYTKGLRMAPNGTAQVVVKGIPDGGHSSRPLAFDSQGRLYVSVGSASNVDQGSDQLELRSQIRRFQLPDSIPAGGIAYNTGEVLATGMRNESGIFVDAQDRLWGVENGRDNLSDSQLGGDIHNDNPGEEINLVDGQGSKAYGYPYCFSEHILNGGQGPGVQWADDSLGTDLRKNDAFCQNLSNIHPPAYVMPAHWAPLGVIQYTGRSLPYTGDLLIGAHGSWNRSPASGRVIARARLQGTTITDLTVLVGEKGSTGQLVQGTWGVRPVEVREGPDEALYVSDDQGGRVLKIGYQR